ncbi:hypothetical protein M011DRAFT_474541 [Sporormia fimetaria CBS 119925]|uniref:Uncharacterized protein n=1 Tax=Sporormia fimetaria CBS 119925 TaxID=1340428 RepID=A0A6A6VHJ0_9PLEO|nr:hypothetical protein M011DRAFT_474541 [Sporormia fimetaria CBS 119925]
MSSTPTLAIHDPDRPGEVFTKTDLDTYLRNLGIVPASIKLIKNSLFRVILPDGRSLSTPFTNVATNVRLLEFDSFDAEANLLSMEDGGADDLKTMYGRPGLDIADIGRRLGTWLAILHASTLACSAPRPSTPPRGWSPVYSRGWRWGRATGRRPQPRRKQLLHKLSKLVRPGGAQARFKKVVHTLSNFVRRRHDRVASPSLTAPEERLTGENTNANARPPPRPSPPLRLSESRIDNASMDLAGLSEMSIETTRITEFKLNAPYDDLDWVVEEFGYSWELGTCIQKLFGYDHLFKDSGCVCHGDFGPANVLVQPASKAARETGRENMDLMVVDWEFVRKGRSATDVGQFAAGALVLDRTGGNRGLRAAFLNTYILERCRRQGWQWMDRTWLDQMTMHMAALIVDSVYRDKSLRQREKNKLVAIAMNAVEWVLEEKREMVEDVELFEGVERRWLEFLVKSGHNWAEREYEPSYLRK